MWHLEGRLGLDGVDGVDDTNIFKNDSRDLKGFRDSHPQVLIGDESWILLSANPFLDGC